MLDISGYIRERVNIDDMNIIITVYLFWVFKIGACSFVVTRLVTVGALARRFLTGGG